MNTNNIFKPMNKKELQTAVNEWYTNKKTAKQKYDIISKWDTSLIKDISYMFKNAKSFNRDLSHWRFYNNHGSFIVLETKDMFLDSGLELINIPVWYKNIHNQSNYI